MNADYVVAHSTVALKQLELANAGGERREIAAARKEVVHLKRELEHVRSERDALALVKAAHACPMRLGTR
jgi:hypothetical protein